MDKLGEIAICLASLLYLLEATVYETTTPGKCLYFNLSTEINFTRLVDGFQRGQKISIKGFINIKANNFMVSIKSYDGLYWFDLDPNITLYFSNFFEYDIKNRRNDHFVRNGFSDESSKTDKAIKIDLIRQADDSLMVTRDDLVLHWMPKLIYGNLGHEAYIRFSGDINVDTICYYEIDLNIHRTSITIHNWLHDPACFILYDQSRNIDSGTLTSLPEGFEEGNMLLIEGSVNPIATYAIIYIRDANKRSLFFLNADFEREEIILTIDSELGWTYRTEKIISNKQLKPNEAFKIEIIRQVGVFLVKVNGLVLSKLSTEFDVNLSSMAYFESTGDVTVNILCYKRLGGQRRQANIYPVSEQISTDPADCSIYDQFVAINMDGLTELSHGFEEGKMLTINGVWKFGAKTFELFILNSNRDFAFRLNVTVYRYTVKNLKISTTSDFSQLVKSKIIWPYKEETNFKIEILRQSADTFVAQADDMVFAEMLTNSYINLTEMAYFGFFGGIKITSVCYNVVKKIRPIPSFKMLTDYCNTNLAKESLVGIRTRLPRTFDNNTSLLINAQAAMGIFAVTLFSLLHSRLLYLAFDSNLNTTSIATDYFSQTMDETHWITPSKNFVLKIESSFRGYQIYVDGTVILHLPRKFDLSYPQLIEIRGLDTIFGVCMTDNRKSIAQENELIYHSLVDDSQVAIVYGRKSRWTFYD